MRNWHFWKSINKGEYRFFLSSNPGGKYAERLDTKLEVAWRKRVSTGFSIRLGNESSETPLDVMLSFYWLAFFWSLRSPGLGKFFEWLGRGHKRELSIRFHDGTMWWKLWYNDDMGYDAYHKCDSWRKPKLWPWSAGRKKHRSWMCLRDGNIDLNPLNAIWGGRYFEDVALERKTKTLRMNQFEGDQYPVDLILQAVYRARRHGPKRVRRRTFEGYRVAWDAGMGIPIRNHSWKGENVISSSEKIDNPANWWTKATISLYKRIEADRIKYRYRPLTDKATPNLIDIPQGNLGLTLIEKKDENGKP